LERLLPRRNALLAVGIIAALYLVGDVLFGKLSRYGYHRGALVVVTWYVSRSYARVWPDTEREE